MWRELTYYAALSPNAFHFHFLPWGLHCEPDDLRREVQQAVDATDGSFDAILLGYGLCSKGVEGVTARNIPLVIVKGHDCITHLLGSKERYQDYFDRHPGTYWYSPGWIENHLPPGPERYEATFRKYVEKFGEDNAQFLMEMEQDWFRKYKTAAYLDLGVGNTEEYEAYTKRCAQWLGWDFDRLEGDARLIKQLVNGDWNQEEFLLVPPGCKIEATYDHNIMRAVPATTDNQSA